MTFIATLFGNGNAQSRRFRRIAIQGILLVVLASIGLSLPASSSNGSSTANDPPTNIARAVLLPADGKLSPAQYSKYRATLLKKKAGGGQLRVRAQAAQLAQTPLFLPPKGWDSMAAPGFATVDINQDGRLDLVTLAPRPAPNQSAWQLSVFIQSANGLLASVQRTNIDTVPTTFTLGMKTLSGPAGQTFLLVATLGGLDILTIQPNGSAIPQPVSVTLPTSLEESLVTADVNHDGLMDFVTYTATSYDYNHSYVARTYLQHGSGAFMLFAEAAIPENDMFFGDLDNDGIQDLIRPVNGAEIGMDYRLGKADGSFGALASFRLPAAGQGGTNRLEVSDLDGDGRNDVVMPLEGTGATVLFQTGNLTFTRVKITASVSNVSHASVGDLDGNGLQDLVFWIDGYHTFVVALQTQVRTFGIEGTYDTGGGYGGFSKDNTAIADLNGDGRRDIALSSALTVYYNSQGTYPVTDAGISGSATVDMTPSLPVTSWHFTVTNAGPSTISDGVFLQQLRPGMEYSSADLSCSYYADLVACPLPAISPGGSLTFTVRTVSLFSTSIAENLASSGFVLIDDILIDTNSSNDGVDLTVQLPARLADPHLAGSLVQVYEGATDSMLPLAVPDSTPFSSQCVDWYFTDSNSTAGLAGLDNALNGGACGRVPVKVLNNAAAGGDATFNIDLATNNGAVKNRGAIRVVDDESTDPRLESAGAMPFAPYPAIYSSIQSVTLNAIPGFASIGDLNGDGRNDIAVSVHEASPAYVLVWLQQVDGTLSPTPLRWDAPAGIGTSHVIGDFLGDGAAELLVPTEGPGVHVVRWMAGSLQTTEVLPIDARRLTLADMDNDGYQDLVATGGFEQSVYGPAYWTPNVRIYRGTPQRTLDLAPQGLAMPFAFAVDMEVADFDGNGRKDIAIPGGRNVSFPTVSIAFQNNDGTFRFPVGIWPSGPQHFAGLSLGESVATGDFNHDGKADLALGAQLNSYGGPLARYATSTWIYSTFRLDEYSAPSQRLYTERENSLAAIDLNQDGRDDLLVDWALGEGFPSQPIRYYVQNSSGQLQLAGQLPVFGSGQLDVGVDKIAVGDFDGDGAQDAVILQQSNVGLVHFMHSQPRTPAYSTTVLEEVASATISQRVRYRFRVTNTADRRSTESQVALTLPARFTATTLVAAKGACYLTNGGGKCELPQLDRNGYVDVMLIGTYAAEGSQQITLTAGPATTPVPRVVTTNVTSASGGGGVGGGSSGTGGTSGGGGWVDLTTLALLLASVAVQWRGRRRPPDRDQTNNKERVDVDSYL